MKNQLERVSQARCKGHGTKSAMCDTNKTYNGHRRSVAQSSRSLVFQYSFFEAVSRYKSACHSILFFFLRYYFFINLFESYGQKKISSIMRSESPSRKLLRKRIHPGNYITTVVFLFVCFWPRTAHYSVIGVWHNFRNLDS